MSTITCEKCAAVLSNAAGKCPKCQYPTPRNRGYCRICGAVLAWSEHRYEVSYRKSFGKYIQHCKCMNCGEPQPLRQSRDTFFGQLVFWIKFFIVIAMLGIGYRFMFGDETKIKTIENSASIPSKTATDLRGKWVGKFIYPKGVETQLTMNLTVSRTSFSGNLTETDPKTNQPVNSTISGSIRNNQKIHFTQDFGAQYPKAKCYADFEAASKSMTGKCAAAGQTANFTAHLL